LLSNEDLKLTGYFEHLMIKAQLTGIHLKFSFGLTIDIPGLWIHTKNIEEIYSYYLIILPNNANMNYKIS